MNPEGWYWDDDEDPPEDCEDDRWDADGDLVFTEFGWAVKKDRPPRRFDMPWQTPDGNIYTWDGDGWYRIKPPEKLPMKMEDLPHG